ncbi:Serine/threonine-protein kinase wnk4 [Perkinsus olseni]|uniref:Serine/threonine-protein kinase wnk4 n=1 Tax=Perkinsus olseni TaxID=32597 RepID=A0A7J6Q179_PEROL|nr:Serine/threonine-protein kinase wnk4 [Perkinsus olseni]KAF4732263.1 Serine/threonine-protein kinase wnk4 [Perkinsus olseni]
MAAAAETSYIGHPASFGGVELLKLPPSTVVDPAKVTLFCQGPYWFKLLISDAQFAALSRSKTAIQDQTGCALAFSVGTCSILGSNYRALMGASSSSDALCMLCRDLVENFIFPASENDGILICIGSDAALGTALNAGGSAISPRGPLATQNGEHIIRVSSKACADLPSVLGILCKEVISSIQADKAGMMKVMEIEYSSRVVNPSPYTAPVPTISAQRELPSVVVPKISISLPLKEAEAKELISAESAMGRISRETETFIQLKRPSGSGGSSDTDLTGYIMTVTGTLDGVQAAHRKVVSILIQAQLNEEVEANKSASSSSSFVKERESGVIVRHQNPDAPSFVPATAGGGGSIFTPSS